MRKFLAIIRREYVQGVRGKAFIISTLIAPVFMLVFLALPQLLMGIKTGGATRVAVVDLTGRMYEPLRESVLRDEADGGRDGRDAGARPPAGGVRPGVTDDGSIQTRFQVERAASEGRPLEEVKAELNRRVLGGELDVYLILPEDILTRGEATLNARNTGDLFTRSVLESRLNRAVIEQRMQDANIDQRRVRELSRNVRLETQKVTPGGERRDEGGSFFFALGVGTFILIAMLMYGQAILSAVVEEKSTRIVEVLFSSVDAFTLLAGKLVGVALVAMTQFAVWALMLLGVVLYGLAAAGGAGALNLPSVPPVALLYALLFFMLGFFIYATVYAVIGSVVTTEKEASQIVVPVSFFPVIAIYLAFPVIRSPNSDFAFWVSMVPFFSPVTMLVRVATETPPFWQIALSLLVGAATVAAMIWVAARVYRTGMLMYGKRATLPEMWRWARRV
jgi:ABC-2 type transport system permease protein